eukprot:TRINITY_DN12903_c0_g1_i1.p2 TRINITY_DN12903_c0_g1~~TRINITY_DN12903_c0_g1_i1.p2  ORF type:complete len:111 (-),score=7.36 TRINITY_DN12903_c0_g1_i1:203-535(-)
MSQQPVNLCPRCLKPKRPPVVEEKRVPKWWDPYWKFAEDFIIIPFITPFQSFLWKSLGWTLGQADKRWQRVRPSWWRTNKFWAANFLLMLGALYWMDVPGLFRDDPDSLD